MALKAIHFKYDSVGQNSGIVTPHIDSILNYYQNIRGTGYYDGIGDGGLVTISIDYTTAGYGKLTFNLGFFSIYGRHAMIEQGTQLSVPLTITSTGSIGIKVNLALAAGLEAQFYSKTSQSLTQNNLFTAPTSGIYELEIYRYTCDGTTLALTRSPNLKALYVFSDLFYFVGDSNHTSSGSSLNAIIKEAYSAYNATYAITQSQGNNSTKIATTSYADTAKAAAISAAEDYADDAVSNFYGSGSISTSPSLSASTNSIKRQGNLVRIVYESTASFGASTILTIPSKCTSGNTSLYLRPTGTEKVFYQINSLGINVNPTSYNTDTAGVSTTVGTGGTITVWRNTSLYSITSIKIWVSYERS